MQVITSTEMAALDANCEYYGLARIQLMENAGASLANIIKQKFPQDTPVTIFAGKGSNGGDAFVAARHLAGYNVQVFLLGRGDEIKTAGARWNFNILKKAGTPIIEITDSTQIPEPDDDCVIIDAIFGTGIKGRLRPLESTAIDRINNCASEVVSVDVPSGLDPDTGDFEKTVRSNLTITFHKPKPALLHQGLKKYIGELVTAPIGIPLFFERLVGKGDIGRLVTRKPESHKGDSGSMLIIGGGPYSGAPALCAMAALRCGVDLVHIAAPEAVSNIIASFSPNLITTALTGNHLTENDIPLLKKIIPTVDVVVIGMGLGKHPETQSALKEIIPLCKKAVIDADGLYALDFQQQNYSDIIITPHSYEFNRITELKTPENLNTRMQVATGFAEASNTTILLKGKTDVIAKGSMAKINTTGTSGMTVGGTGDVLAGITAALFTTNDALLSACCAAFISGRAGEICHGKYGSGLTATDIIEYIPEARNP
ncbi:MAG: NAD(P)H-hydrate dehydratase [Methanosarcinales archaeon]|nr:MAG: NAD(P)H-hydrate dehydratase [Methanosarcinales archaeon]